jgi:hypothetical protein
MLKRISAPRVLAIASKIYLSFAINQVPNTAVVSPFAESLLATQNSQNQSESKPTLNKD